MTKKDLRVLYLTVCVVALMLILLRLINQINTAQVIEITITFGLVCVTAIYVRRTAEIAKATKEQADASTEMAEEMEKQRLSEARPYLLLRLGLADDELLQWDATEQHKNRPMEFKVTILNGGSGPAINLVVALWHLADVYPNSKKGYLAPNEEWEAVISKSSVRIDDEVWLPKLGEYIKKDDPGVIAVKYKDIHNRTWVSYLCLERFDIEACVVEGDQNIVELKDD